MAAYNNDILHGTWIDAVQDEEDLRADVAAMLAASPIPGAEEYAGLTEVAALAVFIAEHGTLGAALVSHFGGDLEEARATLEDRYLGTYASLADYMQDLTEETMEIPSALVAYIDWEAMARDAEINGEVFTIETSFDTLHVFAAW